MTTNPTLYGLLGFSHGGARVLTVMSLAGASTAWQNVAADEDVIEYGEQAHLRQYHEKRSGALQRMIDRYDIQVLSKPEWDTVKAELGASGR